MKNLIMSLLLLSGSMAFATCNHVQVLHGEITTCSTGVGFNTDMASTDALDQAFNEYKNACNSMSDNDTCAKRGLNIRSVSTTCTHKSMHATCDRVISFIFNH